jgi:hypothetical protein
MDYVQEKDDRGKTVIRKVGMAPVQRDGLEYEFDIVGDMNQDHDLVVTKSRCEALSDAVINRPDEALGRKIRAWLSDGAAAPAPPAAVGDGEPSEDEQFTIALSEAFAAREFDEAAQLRVVQGACGKYGLTDIVQLPAEKRREMLAAIGEGKFDKFKQQQKKAS